MINHGNEKNNDGSEKKDECFEKKDEIVDIHINIKRSNHLIVLTASSHVT